MISIFASRLKASLAPDRHLAPFSAVIRGGQIAQAVGGQLNPKSGFYGDTCIYVKSYPPESEWRKFERVPHCDIVDGGGLRNLLKTHDYIPVIACSETDYRTLKVQLRNKITLIPQQHCNFERVRRIREGITTVGIIGTWWAWQWIPKELEAALKERGIKLWRYSEFTCRQDVVEFYQNIDVQVVWRPYPKSLSNPLKLVNAAAFGVPTIALGELAFYEMRGSYLSVDTFAGLLCQLDLLRSFPDFYQKISEVGLSMAEPYHIDKIAALYKELDT